MSTTTETKTLKKVYKITNEKAMADYTGCGKAWGAINGGEVVGIRGMGDFVFKEDAAPKRIRVLLEARAVCAYDHYPLSRSGLMKIKKVLKENGYSVLGPRGGHLKLQALADDVLEELASCAAKQFSEYRKKCRSELSKIGTVVSGHCSCYEFYPSYKYLLEKD